ncbi:MAG: Nif11-like leader peptide family natural product precursor [Pseudomonadales bacterium]|nr:Nif11-like leader peptide family natural product precursor [Pseudomonadales bacterium]
MSVENAERFIRFLKNDPALRARVNEAGWENFQEVSAGAGASCTSFEVVAALIREIEGNQYGEGAWVEE